MGKLVNHKRRKAGRGKAETVRDSLKPPGRFFVDVGFDLDFLHMGKGLDRIKAERLPSEND